MTLPPRRLLNLMYWFWVRGLTAESRATVDEALTDRGPEVVAPAQVRRHVPGLAPPNIPPPSWWAGDRAAFNSSVAAGQQLDEPAALRERRRPGLPRIGTAAMAGVM